MFRYRRKLGEPRNLLERVAQFAWQWRIEASLVYIGIASAASIVLEFYRP